MSQRIIIGNIKLVGTFLGNMNRKFFGLPLHGAYGELVTE